MFLRRFIALVCIGVILWSCVPRSTVSPVPIMQPTFTVFLETTSHSVTVTPSEFALTTASPMTIWLDPSIPSTLGRSLAHPEGVEGVGREEEAQWKWKLLADGEAAAVETPWVYVAAVAFPTITGHVDSAALEEMWRRGGETRLLMSMETLTAFSVVWGKPAGNAVEIQEAADLLEAAWKQPGQIALLPFEELHPRWKVLRVDGSLPFDRDFDAGSYALTLRAGFVGGETLPEGWKVPESNFQPGKLTTLVLTGVTALSRRTAETINEQGPAYVLQDIGEWLRSADLTHVSNEVSFNPECSPQRAASPEARFCSLPSYIEVLELAGTDIVELTGNHNLDYGAEAYRYTLDLYRERGWNFYGGGENPMEARQALLLELNGNRLAFLGCNYAGPQAAWVSEDGPGAAPCDLNWIEEEVRRLSSEGYLPIVTFQSLETEDYKPSPMQRAGDFRRMAQAGAVVVSGSASHWPQSYEFAGDSLLHFGLGNLFFDQMERRQTREAFQDKHIFYQGRYLGVTYQTTLLEDAARPRPMTVDEQAQFLEMIFEASGWK